MGSTYSIGCKECGYADTFSIGIGMLYYPLVSTDGDEVTKFLSSIIK